MCRHLAVFIPILMFLTATCEDSDCTKGPEPTKCLEVLKQIAINSKEFDISNKTSAKTVIENCEKFNHCHHTLDCLTEEKFVYVVNVTFMFCDYVQFFSGPFVPCQTTIEAKVSECNKNWNPFPKETPDQEKMAEVRKTACDNFFGKDNCMQKEITEICGAEMWNGFRKILLALNTALGACKFQDH
ncbi:T20D4.11-like domain-containing protein [Caenorhabditis elegans]|uniref:T20D4.11-like domain-containing protein n=1 Tax=Caenorhabditis elegans TaxID=6239 RepID=O44921_CAEEL|nr:DUF19 domain-containing protein [Caenorhabditis elegans]CCD73663.1 DUF19 domain-containing protein [Caenorhabditis elegans]|eukprot:NP_494575.2 Uncharacterized protein CELE_W10G11.2 [Caenorhabditis elegans]